ncbi:MAG: bifunctional 5,10-methylenetetrahydrofolate dehydrogenase/5,10-methenyltetrahydrofolate cyclohydrolase [Oscillospiraceae bacterium]|nr:bifunctional 5,10-methylenetetrahydrofolate dehydrogenase/5,10-methenyltetrahydrofolate cyclohydrolase [Oscillospiraceae bacterium]
MAELLKGGDVVNYLNDKMKSDIEVLKGKSVTPTLAILRVGERPDDLSYEKTAMKRCETIGVEVKNVVLPADVKQGELMKSLETLNNDKSVHGILMFRPLPAHLDENEVVAALKPEKDIDGITGDTWAKVVAGGGKGFAPCTAQACIEILDFYKIDVKGKNVCVIGHSLVVGRPVGIMLLGRDATVSTCHVFTKDTPYFSKAADIVIIAVGLGEFFDAKYFSPGQVVIDVGINWSDEKKKLVGDVKFDEAEKIVSQITPVPGGVGTVTTSVLVSNVVAAAKNQTM